MHLFTYLKNFENITSKISKFKTYSSMSKKFKVFVTQPIPNESLEILESSNYDLVINKELPLERSKLIESIQDCDGLFCTLNERIDKELLSAANNLKVLCLI